MYSPYAAACQKKLRRVYARLSVHLHFGVDIQRVALFRFVAVYHVFRVAPVGERVTAVHENQPLGGVCSEGAVVRFDDVRHLAVRILNDDHGGVFGRVHSSHSSCGGDGVFRGV